MIFWLRLKTDEKMRTRTARQQGLAANRLGERSKPVAQERTSGNAEPRGAMKMFDMTARTNPNGIRPPFEPIRNLLRHISLPFIGIATVIEVRFPLRLFCTAAAQ